LKFANDNLRQQGSMYNNCYVTFYTPQHKNCTNISKEGRATSVTLAMNSFVQKKNLWFSYVY